MDERLMRIFQRPVSQERRITEVREYLKTLPRKNLPPNFWKLFESTENISVLNKRTEITAREEIHVQPLNVQRILRCVPNIAPWNSRLNFFKPMTERERRIMNLMQSVIKKKRWVYRQHFIRELEKPDVITLWRSTGSWNDDVENEELPAVTN